MGTTGNRLLTRRAVISGLAATTTLPIWACSPPKNPDVVVIGAGSAGLAAARSLIAQGKTVVVVEGAGRIGGRAYTESSTLGVPLDQGCSWVEGPKDLAYVKMANDWNYTLHNHKHAGEVFYVGDRRATRSERSLNDSAWMQIEAIIEKTGRAGKDVPAASVIPKDLKYSGVAQTWIGPMDWGVDLVDLSTMDHFNYGDIGSNYLIKEGYGTLVAQMGAGLPVQLNTPATRIDWSGSGVAVETPAGTIRAKACIVTVSTGVLSAGSIRFTPELPQWKQRAIGNLPMGLLAKVTLQFDGERFGFSPNKWLSYNVPNEMPAEACYFLTFPHDFNHMIGFVGGSFGWELSAAGTDEAVDFALGELTKMVGSRVRKHFVKGHLTKWGENPWTLGTYAAALPGSHKNRNDLAKPIAERIFFAGEAVAMPYVALCGGAYMSGEAVAKDVAATIA